MTEEQKEKVDMELIKQAFACLEMGVNVFEKALAGVSLKPNGKASDIVALCHCHKRVADEVEANRPVVESL